MSRLFKWAKEPSDILATTRITKANVKTTVEALLLRGDLACQSKSCELVHK